jgi:hypothetical protein
MENEFELYTRGYLDDDNPFLKFAVDLDLIESVVYYYLNIEWLKYVQLHLN